MTGTRLGLYSSLWACFLTLGCGVVVPPSLPEPYSESFRVVDVRLVEPARKRTRPTEIVVAGGEIRSPSDASEDTQLLEEFAGTTVLPGLVDLHMHFPPDTPLALTPYFGLLYLAHGVTRVRDAGDLDATGIPAAREATASGAPMPRIHSCGPFVGGAKQRWLNWIALERSEQASEIARSIAEAGHDCVKVYDDLDQERVQALVSAAEDADLVAIGHVPFGLTVEQAAIPDVQHLMGIALPEDIRAGDHVVHRVMDWRGVDDARMAVVVEGSRTLGLAHTPTLGLGRQIRNYATYERSVEAAEFRWIPPFYRHVVWNPDEGLPLYRGLTREDFAMIDDAWHKKLAVVRRLHEAGVPLRVGTDTQQPWIVPGLAVWNEVSHFVEAGIPTEEALAYATWRAGTGIGEPDMGALEPGAPADLLFFREDPTHDVEALDSLEAVVVDGKLYRRSDLLEALEQWSAWYERPWVDAVARFVARRKLESAVTGDR